MCSRGNTRPRRRNAKSSEKMSTSFYSDRVVVIRVPSFYRFLWAGEKLDCGEFVRHGACSAPMELQVLQLSNAVQSGQVLRDTGDRLSLGGWKTSRLESKANSQPTHDRSSLSPVALCCGCVVQISIECRHVITHGRLGGASRRESAGSRLFVAWCMSTFGLLRVELWVIFVCIFTSKLNIN